MSLDSLQPEYALFQSSLPSAFHERMLSLAESLAEDTPHAYVPAGIVGDPAVIISVRDLLGPDARPDVCRHVHINASPEDGPWHQDDYDGAPWPVGVDFGILFYFPQAIPAEMGGTAVLVDGREVIAVGPAGTCLLARGDVVHRARANTTGRVRYMLKYLFRAERHLRQQALF